MALPLAFEPKIEATFVRIGRDNDGGYLVDKKSIAQTDCLVSFGLSTDCSFEHKFKKIKDIPIIAYDHTINFLLFRNIVRNKFWTIFQKLLKTRHRREAIRNFLQLLASYKLHKKLFSQNNIIHKQQAIGCTRNNYTDVKAVIEQLHMAFDSLNKDQKIFFKIDIEGSEYRILDQLIDIQDRISGLVIEFHDCDLHQQRIISFIKAFKLPLGHIHGNNYGGISNDGDPLVLEMTFCSQDNKSLAGPWSGCELDQPNDSQQKELSLIFKKV